jgi:hypothetical protein
MQDLISCLGTFWPIFPHAECFFLARASPWKESVDRRIVHATWRRWSGLAL